MTKAEDFLSPLTQSHILMNKAQAALWLWQSGYDLREIAKVVELPGLLPKHRATDACHGHHPNGVCPKGIRKEASAS
jgi:hypothetical protein